MRFDLKKRPIPIINVKTAVAISTLFLKGSGMNGRGALINISTGHVVKTKRRETDWSMKRQANGRTLVLKALSGVEVLKSSI
jgi:hypothetical protein